MVHMYVTYITSEIVRAILFTCAFSEYVKDHCHWWSHHSEYVEGKKVVRQAIQESLIHASIRNTYIEDFTQQWKYRSFNLQYETYMHDATVLLRLFSWRRLILVQEANWHKMEAWFYVQENIILSGILIQFNALFILTASRKTYPGITNGTKKIILYISEY